MGTGQMCKNSEGDPAKPDLAATTCWASRHQSFSIARVIVDSLPAISESQQVSGKYDNESRYGRRNHGNWVSRSYEHRYDVRNCCDNGHRCNVLRKA